LSHPLESESCVLHCGPITSNGIVILSIARNDGADENLLLNDLGVLNHCDTPAFGQLAFHGDGLAAILGELIVDWLVFANDQLRFALADDAGSPAALDALGSAGRSAFVLRHYWCFSIRSANWSKK
jgi:hypothetical protein